MYVYEELSLIRGWQYRHCILIKQGAETRFLNDEEDISDNRALYEALNEADVNIDYMEDYI